MKEIIIAYDENTEASPVMGDWVGELVRCKDCKYGKIHGIDVECIAHEEVGYDPEPWHPLDWFCADGEKSD